VSLEQLLLLALFVLVPLLNFLVGALRRRFAGPMPEEPARTAPTAPPLSSPRIQRREAPSRPPGEPPPPSPEASETRRRWRLELGRPQEMRRAIVLMAVLGPCRGWEPPGSSVGDASPDRARR
jgi:hypothetical protein